MSLEAIEKVVEIEKQMRESKSAAETNARQIISEAGRDGLAALQKVRAAAAENGKDMLKRAEERAAEKAAEIRCSAEAEGNALREAAEKQLEEAAEFIVGRVVSH